MCKRNLVSVVLTVSLLLTVTGLTQAATPEEIQESIDTGTAWLVSEQEDNGSWDYDVARTGFVLIKLQDRAYELGLDPFETNPAEPDYYEYAANVITGWEYLFTPSGVNDGVYAKKQTIGTQDHTLGASGAVDDPDTRINGYGIYFSGRSIYYTGICLMALASSRAPGRINDGGIDYDGDGNAETFGEIAQDVVDWLAFAQADVGIYEGGFSYSDLDNACWSADNSNSGYAYLGLAAAEGFGCTVPSWVKTELNVWIDYVQNDPGVADDGNYCPDDPDGGSGYEMPQRWVNELKTGNLIFEMTFFGDNTGDQRLLDALDYIQRHWHDENYEPGWGYNQGSPAHYQAMYCLMKGLEYSGIDLLDLDGDTIAEHDWYEEFADVLVNQQNMPAGYWASSPAYVWYCDGSWGTMSGEILSTVWALLILEKIAPPPPVIEVPVDIKPTSCPNPVNVNSNGVLPVAIVGTEDLDVTTIDPLTIRLVDVVTPLRCSYEDVVTPYYPLMEKEDELSCTEEGPDGYLDLTLKFDKQEVVEAIGEVNDGDVIVLTLTGNLLEEYGGTPITGEDVIIIRKKGRK